MITTFLDWLRHKWVRQGETVWLHDSRGVSRAVVTDIAAGFGRYAAVRLHVRSSDTYRTIRRDGIRRDEHGDWRYVYEDAPFPKGEG